MSETNIGALTGSKIYTGTVDSKNIFDLYQFNIKRCRRRLKPRLHK
jgi:hypothetical protein